MPVLRPVVRPTLISYNERAIPVQTKERGCCGNRRVGNHHHRSVGRCRVSGDAWAARPRARLTSTSGSKNAQRRPNGE
jgi:hypothetical protein